MSQFAKISTIALCAAMLWTAPAGAISLNLGGSGDGLLNLGGGSEDQITVDTGDLLNGGGGTNTTTAVTIDGGGNGILGLFGEGDADTNAALSLGGENADAILNLFGGEDTTTTADINLGGTGTGNTNVLLDLFGSGSGTAGLPLIGSDSGLDDTSVVLDLFGSTGGSGGGSGPGGGGGSGGGSNGGGATPPRVQVASLDDGSASACFTPDAGQIATLVGRHDYSQLSAAAWSRITDVRVIEVNLCAEAQARLAALDSANLDVLQNFIRAHGGLAGRLGGHSAGDVIAVDQSGTTLVVYVM